MAVKTRIKSITLDADVQAAVLQFAFGKMIDLADEAGPKIVDAAKGRVKNSTAKTAARELDARSTKPNKGSLQKINLRPDSHFPGGRAGSLEEKQFFRHAELAKLGKRGIVQSLKAANKNASTKSKGHTQFFRGTRANGTLDRSPDIIVARGNALLGVFSNTGTGHLRDSIHYMGAEIVGNSVIATVRAEADYALYVHEGFTHRGGRHHKGAATHIPANPFLKSALDINGRATVGG